MVESGAIANVVTFGDEVVVDLVLHTPAMHIKNVLKTISKNDFGKVSAEAKIKINSKVEVPDKPEVKGKAIQESKYYSCCLRKGGVGKSTVTANLAVSLAKMGFGVGV